jgi:hypothetical protein
VGDKVVWFCASFSWQLIRQNRATQPTRARHETIPAAPVVVVDLAPIFNADPDFLSALDQVLLDI